MRAVKDPEISPTLLRDFLGHRLLIREQTSWEKLLVIGVATTLREVPALDNLAWSMQSLATNLQRPWVHFAPAPGERPYCRSTKFRRDPIRAGKGLTQAASTGERPCPKCVARLGDKAPAVMAEFCMTEEELMQQTMCA